MIRIFKTNFSFKEYLPLFLLLCFSGNPIVTNGTYSKNLLIIYAVILSFIVFEYIGRKIPFPLLDRLAAVIVFIVVLSIFQQITLGFVSYKGVFALILKILVGLFTFLYYQHKKIDFLHVYIKLLAILVMVSIPFFILNQFVYGGINVSGGLQKSMILYTPFNPNYKYDGIRNAGMFWEPGAFSGYLLLALVFIIIKNGKLVIGQYKKEVLLIILGVITTLSTTGYVILGVIIIFYFWQRYKYGKFILLPLLIGIMSYAYLNLDFLNKKIKHQFLEAAQMKNGDVVVTRFGSFLMDLKYIKAKPLIGNGLDIKTRFRFDPSITKDDIGLSNGMSSIIAYWGIPFFMFWLYCVFKFAYTFSGSIKIALISLFLIVFLLQGETFLNFPLFLSFFVMPFSGKRMKIKKILQSKNIKIIN